MNSFLRKQLQANLNDFLQGKSDEFLITLVEWFSFGDGPAAGSPDSSRISNEDLQKFIKDIVGEKTLERLIDDLAGKNKFFSALEASEKTHLTHLHQMLMEECFHRFKRNTWNSLIEASKKRTAQAYAELAAECKKSKKSLREELKKSNEIEKKEIRRAIRSLTKVEKGAMAKSLVA